MRRPTPWIFCALLAAAATASTGTADPDGSATSSEDAPLVCPSPELLGVLQRVHDADRHELARAKVATSRATTEDIREYARAIADQYEAFDDRRSQYADLNGIALGAEPKDPVRVALRDTERALEQILARKSGVAFDIEYLAPEPFDQQFLMDVAEQGQKHTRNRPDARKLLERLAAEFLLRAERLHAVGLRSFGAIGGGPEPEPAPQPEATTKPPAPSPPAPVATCPPEVPLPPPSAPRPKKESKPSAHGGGPEPSRPSPPSIQSSGGAPDAGAKPSADAGSPERPSPPGVGAPAPSPSSSSAGRQAADGGAAPGNPVPPGVRRWAEAHDGGTAPPAEAGAPERPTPPAVREPESDESEGPCPK